MCKIMNVTRSVYLRWLKHPYSERTLENMELAKVIRDIHVNGKCLLRICRYEGIQSILKHSANSITKQTDQPCHNAEAPNQKWLTEVTEFNYHEGTEIHKVYLSAILDLYDRRIFSYVISNTN